MPGVTFTHWCCSDIGVGPRRQQMIYIIELVVTPRNNMNTLSVPTLLFQTCVNGFVTIDAFGCVSRPIRP